MEAGGGETRLTRRAASEARSRGTITTIENPVASNPFAALDTRAAETGDNDEDSENELTEGSSAFQATPGAPRPKRSLVVRTPKRKTAITDTIVVASDAEDFSICTQRRLRKPSAKAKQNEVVQDLLETRRTDGKIGDDEQATLE